MPKLIHAVPKYRHHRGSGQAIVTIDGKDFYLGPWKSKASRIEYDRIIGEWQANGRRLSVDTGTHHTVVELAAAFLRHAQKHYVKNGRQTNELKAMKTVLRYLKELYGHTDVENFRPLCMEAIRLKMIAAGNSRRYVNQNMSRIKHIFKWGVSKELVPETVYRALATVEGLLAGKSDARETAPVLPIDDATVEATLPHLPQAVADMVRLQRLTGMRPGEVVLIRPSDVDRSGAVWQYRPAEHKMEHKGRGRVILLGPQAQAILLPYLLREADSYCFIHDRTPVNRFSTATYRAAIHRGCELAFGLAVELRGRIKLSPEQKRQATAWRAKHCWDPNRLRHSAATNIRKRFGIEASQVVLGHAKPDTTLIYAERDLEKAASVMAEVG